MDRVDDVSGEERSRRELEMAEELGLALPLPMSLEATFAAEAIVQMPEPSDLASRNPSLSQGLRQRTRGAIPRRDNQLVDIPDAAASFAAVEGCLGIINDANRTAIIPLLLSTFGDAAAQVDDVSDYRELHERVLRAAFGDRFFRNAREARRPRRKPGRAKREG